MKTIALIGNPNSGKTTIFNELTGGRQIIGNWPGVTVEKKEGTATLSGHKVRAVDLPGIYSLSAQSEDERVSLDFILNGGADLVVNIIDADNIQRNLYLTTQLLEMKVPMVVVLNRIDLARKHHLEIDVNEFAAHLRLPVVAVDAHHADDLARLRECIGSSLANLPVSPVRIEYQDELEELLSVIQHDLECDRKQCFTNLRWAAVKMLEKDFFALEHAGFSVEVRDRHRDRIAAVERICAGETDVIIADYRFGFIKGLFEHAVRRRADRKLVSDLLDRFALNRFIGMPLFLAVMYLVFKLTIDIGGSLISFFDIMTNVLVTRPLGMLADFASFPVWLRTILVDGAGVGVQSVMTFIPIIGIMFLMLSVLEDSGYMARAAFVMDRFMQKIGLPGKSFVPMIVGFGCSVPAIMATRTLESSRDRLVTIFLVPLMSCGARLPVYAVFAAVFFPDHGGLVVFSLYIAGVLLAIATGFLFRLAIFRGEVSHFVMELPVYNVPRPKHILIHTWNKLKLFVLSAGKVIVIGSILLALLNAAGTDGTFGRKESTSLMTKVGRASTVVFEPMGIGRENWPAVVAIITGVFSKESVVGTLNALYSQINDEAPGNESFTDMVKSAFASVPEYFSDEGGVDDTSTFAAARSHFSNGLFSVYAYLLFVLIYFPCLSALGAIVGELGLKGALLSGAYLTVLAWGISVLFYQVAQGHDPLWIAAALGVLAGIVAAFFIAGRHIRRRKLYA